MVLGEKYKDSCYKCGKNPCMCINFKEIYISTTSDIQEEYGLAVKSAEKLGLHVISRSQFQNDETIEKDDIWKIRSVDSGIVIVGDLFKLVVYSEFIMLRQTISERMIFIYTRKDSSIPQTLISQLESMPNFNYYRNQDHLSKMIDRDLQNVKKVFTII